MTIWVIFCAACLAGCCLVNWDSRRRELRSIAYLREATESFKEARHEREEAHRILGHVLEEPLEKSEEGSR